MVQKRAGYQQRTLFNDYDEKIAKDCKNNSIVANTYYINYKM